MYIAIHAVDVPKHFMLKPGISNVKQSFDKESSDESISVDQVSCTWSGGATGIIYRTEEI